MNIAFVINSLNRPAGTERITSLLANELVKIGYNVTIIAIHNSGEPFFKLDNKINVLYLCSKPKTNIYLRFPVNIIKLKHLITKNKINKVIDVCSAMSLMSIPATFFTKVKVITWEHFNANINWNIITSPLARKLASMFSSQIVTLTQTDATIFKNKFKAKNVITIPNPITIESNEKATLQEKVILSIGRFERQKGFDMLIDAWRQCSCKNNNWQLKIVGEGTLEKDIKKQIAEYNLNESVDILPPNSQITEIYKKASIYVMSSRFEGLPLVLIEAMYMGLPIISFDCETGPRDIVENGKTGLLVFKNDTTALSKAIDKLTQNPSLIQEYSANAIIASKKFELKPIVKLWEKILK
ncbi:hypothetical protein HW49_00585 [Porphyromonadaceae bacterium COT-184 OH4590]|nr:hypothetical protein HW49_00585 [Porphyromonadaceae bacterium COT-184 OH4590]